MPNDFKQTLPRPAMPVRMRTGLPETAAETALRDEWTGSEFITPPTCPPMPQPPVNNTPWAPKEPASAPMTLAQLYPHYHKDVSHLDSIDVYRVLELWNVTDQAVGHAIKKLLAAGSRGAGKSIDQDVKEALDTLNRRQGMRAEDQYRNQK